MKLRLIGAWIAGLVAAAVAAAPRPNIVFILADDLAMADLGCYGQTKIRTPRLDRMAAEGMRFTQAYCGTSVCAPSRASLMTGLHCGHCPIRANREGEPEGQMPLPPGTLSVAQVLKSAGYATACAGKWGMGMFGTSGDPLKVGFDHFYGYNCQRHAHSYFPTHLYDDDRRVELPGNDGQGVGRTYAQDLIAADVLRWIRSAAGRPFFLFFAVTLPHGRYEIDDLWPYRDEPWTDRQKTYAAMVTRLDTDVGRVLDLLKELNVDERTLVIFSADNGSALPPADELHQLFGHSMGGRLRGIKRSLYEGGLRNPTIARWPGVVPAGRVCDEPWAFWDFLPTAAELADATLPEEFRPDGVSIVPLLRGGPAPAREYFYWELHERSGPSLQAARFGTWKAVRNGPSAPVELYDLALDPGEVRDLSAERPERVRRALEIFQEAHRPDPNWPLVDRPPPRKRGTAR